MIDFGLLASMIIAFGIPTLVAQWRWPLHSYTEPGRSTEPGSSAHLHSFFDAALGPALAGVVVGRLAAVLLDDPRSLTRVTDLLIIRSGVEFWPGLVAVVAVVAWGARRDGITPSARLADLAPLAMIGYACYEATCFLRGGCFGPESPIGLRPPDLETTMLPIGIVTGLVVVAGAVAVRGLSEAGREPSEVHSEALSAVGREPQFILAAAATVVATVRAIGSIWLPHVGDGLTRPHQTSVAVAVVSVVAVGVLLARSARTVSNVS